MALFEKVEFPEINLTSIYITDDYSHRAELSPQQALDLLQWLYERQVDLEILAQPQTQTLREQKAESEE